MCLDMFAIVHCGNGSSNRPFHIWARQLAEFPSHRCAATAQKWECAVSLQSCTSSVLDSLLILCMTRSAGLCLVVCSTSFVLPCAV